MSAALMSRSACSSMKLIARRNVAVVASFRSAAVGSVNAVLGKTTSAAAASIRPALPITSGCAPAAGLFNTTPLTKLVVLRHCRARAASAAPSSVNRIDRADGPAGGGHLRQHRQVQYAELHLTGMPRTVHGSTGLVTR